MRQFTALATVTGDKPYQVKLSKNFQPWRLAVQFHPCNWHRRKTPGRSTLLVKEPEAHRGPPFRRGLFTIPRG